MAKKRSTRRSTRAISFNVPAKVKKALAEVQAEKLPVRIVGRVKKKNLEIDYNALVAFSKTLPKSNIWFLALNAPFKTSVLTHSQ